MSTAYRYGVWFVKGIREFTKAGYDVASKNFESLDGISVNGRSYLITGANSGIGKETAMEIAKRGGTIHMVCRNEVKGKEAQDEIKTHSGNDDVHLHILDMSEPQKVYLFAKQFVETSKPLHVIINNAGCMENTRVLTEDGLEKNFATNTLGTYVLTSSLIDHIKKFDSPQVITVTSGGMLLVKLKLDDLQLEEMNPFDGAVAYSLNKRQQVVMTDHWTKQHPQIQFTTMHPGWADTPAVRLSLPDFHRRMGDRLRTPYQGADTLIWLCVSETARKLPGGGFYQDRKSVKKHLPLAWTKSSTEEEDLFVKKLEEISSKYTQ
ncbi:dehydrogenase/reductase SDR family member 12-like [Hydractinia symbiolongicarpus]|uniref:dehydrogenase/reductase SDR family member 12-like n=1 Tax=Hydractinia symbiolongicarpus TaxID=13093 RepID=UPI00254ABD5D|nr:dehydrogenase/reductase SDR family member 12-like [Hydractinia symbiolongicarpus]